MFPTRTKKQGRVRTSSKGDSQLIQHPPIFPLSNRLILSLYTPIILVEGPTKATKHSHDSEFKLAVRITSARIKYHFFNTAITSNRAFTAIAAPKIAMDHNWHDG